MEHKQQKGRATLRDVARWAEVSVMTVSNVVNQRDNQVSDQVRQRVLKGIAELDYRPHVQARSLRLSRHYSIGLIFVHPDRRFLNDPFNTEVAAGMSNHTSSAGYGLLVIGAQDITELRGKIDRFSDLDAVAVQSYGDRAQRRAVYAEVSKLGLPMMLIGDDLTDDLTDVSYITQHNESGAAQLTREVLGFGARSLLFVKPDHVWSAITRRERGVMAAADGVASVETLSCSEVDFAAIVARLTDRLRRSPAIDAIIGSNDMFGIAGMQAVAAVGRVVARDIIVTGFNGFPFREFSQPLLTSVRSRSYDIGVLSAQRLIARVDAGAFTTAGETLDVTLLPGDSTPPFAQSRPPAPSRPPAEGDSGDGGDRRRPRALRERH